MKREKLEAKVEQLHKKVYQLEYYLKHRGKTAEELRKAKQYYADRYDNLKRMIVRMKAAIGNLRAFDIEDGEEPLRVLRLSGYGVHRLRELLSGTKDGRLAVFLTPRELRQLIRMLTEDNAKRGIKDVVEPRLQKKVA